MLFLSRSSSLPTPDPANTSAFEPIVLRGLSNLHGCVRLTYALYRITCGSRAFKTPESLDTV